jgi:predicted Zn-dependent protease
MRSDLVARVVADVLRDQRAVENVRAASRVDIARFSREQEFEADAEGIATLARAGYDPYGATRFLGSLERWEGLSRARTGAQMQQSAYDMFATHPATGQRIDAAGVLARQLAERAGAGDARGRDVYLAAINGMTFGDGAADGLVRGGRHYAHGRLRIGFSAPQGFTLDNSSRAVLGSSADESRRILFDLVEAEPGQDLESVLASTWTDDLTAEDIRRLTVNGLETATARSRGQDWHFRIAALRHDGGIYRLIFAHRPQDGAADRLFEETLSSIRAMSARDIAAFQPPRIRIHRAGSRDDVASMARRMSGAGQSVSVFRVLNGLDADAAITPGQSYKIVVE